MNDFFNENYPQLSRLYADYTNTESYMHSPMEQAVDKATNKATDRAFELLNAGAKNRAYDELSNSGLIYEQSGFIQGFALAMKLIGEGAKLTQTAK